MEVSVKGLLVAGSFSFLAACSAQNSGGLQGSRSDSAIIGGTAVSLEDPLSSTTVQLYHLDVTKNPVNGKMMVTGLESCTGTLITQDIIISAGHCTAANPKQLFVLFSDQIPTDFRQFLKDLPNNPNVRHIVAGVTAPNWSKAGFTEKQNWGDMSLLRFEGGLPQGYTTASLAPADLNIPANAEVTLAGFGETDGVKRIEATQLMKAVVKIADSNFSQTEIKIGHTEGRGACHGDSGGPAYITANGQSYLLGITSRADTASDPEAVCVGNTIYTNVQPYLTWISEEVKKLDTDSSYGQTIAEPADQK